jgi:hypothetical protein
MEPLTVTDKTLLFVVQLIRAFIRLDRLVQQLTFFVALAEQFVSGRILLVDSQIQ